MKLGKIFICINILVLSLLMLTGCTEKWPRIIYQNTSYRFDEYNRTIVLDGYHFAMKRIIKNNYQPNSNPEFDLEAEEFSVYRNIERQISCPQRVRILII